MALAALWLTATAAPPDPAKGRELFVLCRPCHALEDVEGKIGPGLKGLFRRRRLADGARLTDKALRVRIEAGGRGMPSFQDLLSPEEREHLLAFLKTL